jgi:hypothetical protein
MDPDPKRNKKSDKAKRNWDLNGKYNAKAIRKYETLITDQVRTPIPIPKPKPRTNKVN